MKRVRAESDAGFIRTTAALPPDLHRRLVIATLETRITGAEIIRRALVAWLDARDRKGSTKARRGGAR